MGGGASGVRILATRWLIVGDPLGASLVQRAG